MLFVLPAVSQSEKKDDKDSKLSYTMTTVSKVLESNKDYTVIYRMNGMKLGSVRIPKSWAQYKADTPKKLLVRDLPSKVEPYITVVKLDGEFYKVILTLPRNKRDPVWGVSKVTPPADTDDKESIELVL